MICEDGVRPLPLAAAVRLGDLALDEEGEIRVLEPIYVYVRVHRRVAIGGEGGQVSLFVSSLKSGESENVQCSVQFNLVSATIRIRGSGMACASSTRLSLGGSKWGGREWKMWGDCGQQARARPVPPPP